MNHRIPLAAIALCGAPVTPALAQSEPTAAPQPAAAPPQEENSGQDPTKPVARFDTRIQYANLPNGFEQGTLTLRVDKPFDLGGGWKLNTRFDVPTSLSNVPGPGNPPGKTDFGLDDALVQLLAVKPLNKLWAVAFGGQLIVPTGTPAQFSSGKWQLVPTAVVVRQLPGISRGSFVGLLLRDSFSFAGPDHFKDSNTVSIQPIFNLQLPKAWFVTMSPELKLDTLDGWKAQLPFDITIGKKVARNIVVSLQADVMVIDTYPAYDWKTEFRVGLFF